MPLNMTVHDDLYFSDEFKTIIRSCKEVIIEKIGSPSDIIDLDLQFIHRNDFYTYMRRISEEVVGLYNMDERLLWTIAFINDITDPGNWYPRHSLYIPSLDIIEDIIAPLKTQHKK